MERTTTSPGRESRMRNRKGLGWTLDGFQYLMASDEMALQGPVKERKKQTCWVREARKENT